MRTPKMKLQNVSSLSDLMFPVQMIEQTNFECLKDCRYEIFVYPYQIEVEKQITSLLAIPEKSVNESTLVVIDEISEEIAECFEVTMQTDFSCKLRVNVCSDQYKLVPNTEIYPAIEQILIDNNINFKVEYSMINFSKFYVKYTILDKRFEYSVGNGDTIQPIISVLNSYNGAYQYKIILGWYRFICSNGLVIALEDMKKFNLCIVGKHTEKIESSLHKFEELLSIFDQGNSTLGIVFNKFNILNNHKITNLTNAIETACKKAGIILVDNSKLNTVNYVTNKINSEMSILKTKYPNNWLLYNAINFYIYDNTLSGSAPELRADKDQKVFEYLLKDALDNTNQLMLSE